MKIHSISKVLAIFPFLAILYFLMYGMGNHESWSVLIFIPVFLLVLLYNFYGQIDYWWNTKNPEIIDPKLKEWLLIYSPFYIGLNEEQKKKFEERLMLYIDAREYKSVGTKEHKEVPFDIKGIIASQAIRLTLGLKDFLIGDLDRIYCYKHPFPTPRYHPLHTVEVDAEDGMLILSLEHAIAGIVNPTEYFNIAIYGYAQAFLRVNPNYDYPEVGEETWSDISLVTGMPREAIEDTIGLLPIDMRALHIMAFFDFKDKYTDKFQINSEKWERIFGA